MEWQFHAADAALAMSSRQAFTKFLRAFCTTESDCEGAEIVYGELVGNVVRHAPGSIDIAVHSDAEGSVSMDVSDTGPAFTLAPSLPAALSQCGRGLFVVSQLCRDLTAARTDCGNRVHVVLPVTASAGESESSQVAI